VVIVGLHWPSQKECAVVWKGSKKERVVESVSGHGLHLDDFFRTIFLVRYIGDKQIITHSCNSSYSV